MVTLSFFFFWSDCVILIKEHVYGAEWAAPNNVPYNSKFSERPYNSSFTYVRANI